MSKYIKWELKEEIRTKFIPLIVIAIVYLLTIVVPDNSSLSGIVSIPFTLILISSLVLSYVYGAYRTMKSYEKPTFLLESMIPLSPSKILLVKYLLGIIFNILFTILFIIGFAIVLYKIGEMEMIKEILKLFFNLDINGKTVIIRLLFMMLSSTISFTTFTTLVYLIIKSLFPNSKRVLLVSFITGGILYSVILSSGLKELFKNLQELGQADILYSVVLLGVSVVCYFISVWFIKNKLEVYN